MIVQPSQEKIQACCSLYERLQTFLLEAETYDRIATIEWVREDVFDPEILEEEEEEVQLAPAALDDTPPKVKDPIEKINLGNDIEPIHVAISTYLEPDQRQELVSLLL